MVIFPFKKEGEIKMEIYKDGTFPILGKMHRIHAQRKEGNNGELLPASSCMDLIKNTENNLDVIVPSDIVIVGNGMGILYVRNPEEISEELTPLDNMASGLVTGDDVILKKELVDDLEKRSSMNFSEDIVEIPKNRLEFGDYLPRNVESLMKHPFMLAVSKNDPKRIQDYFEKIGSLTAKIPNLGELAEYAPRGLRYDLAINGHRFSLDHPKHMYSGFKTGHYSE